MTAPTIWTGCYADSWKGVITDESFAHPAKFSRGLISRIYAYLIERQILVPDRGDLVFDPFAGVALGALHALSYRIHWIGSELEERFFKIGLENIHEWETDLKFIGKKTTTAGMACADSRYFCPDPFRQATAIISSPPFMDQEPSHAQNDTPSRRRLLATTDRRYNPAKPGAIDSYYGTTQGQLGIAKGEAFWKSALEIINNCHAILKINGYAVWVLKDFVVKGEVYNFTVLWRALCEQVGFHHSQTIHAMLREEKKVPVLFGEPGETMTKVKERKSFFSQAERKARRATDRLRDGSCHAEAVRRQLCRLRITSSPWLSACSKRLALRSE